MNQRQARDWSREPWIKQHVREPLDDLLRPLMQRAVREYLRKKAEADGSLVVDREDPIGALIHALGAHEAELGLAHEAVTVLLRDGVLRTDGRSIWMPERPASQARAPVPIDEESVVPSAPSRPRQTSTNRVRDHRERKRNERNAQAGVSPRVPAVPEAVSLTVSPPVSSGVPASRGNRNQDPPHSQKDQKDQKDSHHHPEEDARASGCVPLPVSPSVSGADEDDDETLNDVGNGNDRLTENGRVADARPPTSFAEAIRIDVAARAAVVVDNPELADPLRPDQWPEVKAVVLSFATARGCPSQPLGRYAEDKAVQHAVALFAAGYSEADLVHVVRVIANQEWAKGKGLGSLLTFKVMEANRPKPIVKTDAKLSPRVAAAIARVEDSRRIREAG
jgi:hypothetical protein